MRNSRVLFAGTFASAIVLGCSSEHQQALQRKLDLQDKSPLSDTDVKILEGMLHRGALSVVQHSGKGWKRARGAGKVESKVNRNIRGLKKSGKDSSHKPHPQESDGDDDHYYDDFFYPGDEDDLILYGDDYVDDFVERPSRGGCRVHFGIENRSDFVIGHFLAKKCPITKSLRFSIPK